MNDFQVFDLVRMKKNLKKIDTYGISPHVIREQRNTIFKIRQIIEKEGNEGAIRFYGEFSMAYWNPEMFEKVEKNVEVKKEWKEKLFLMMGKVWKEL